MSVSSSVPVPARRWRFWLPWISALVFVAGLVTFLIVYNVGGLRNTSKQLPETPLKGPAQQVQNLGPHVPLSAEVKQVATQWIRASVLRRDLVKSWRLTAPELKQGLTLAEWKTGNIPVVPFPAAAFQAGGIVRVNWSTAKNASFEVTMLAKPGSGVKAQEFFINLKRLGTGKNRHWLVSGWGPRSFPPIPDASSTR
jgi:hypothetical protein